MLPTECWSPVRNCSTIFLLKPSLGPLIHWQIWKEVNGCPVISPSEVLCILWPRIVLVISHIANYHVLTWLTLFQKKRDSMSILASIYQNVFKRSSTFVVAVAFGAIGVCRAFPLHFLSFFHKSWHWHAFRFQFERGFDAFADYLWETKNKGKLWKVNFGAFFPQIVKLVFCRIFATTTKIKRKRRSETVFLAFF